MEKEKFKHSMHVRVRSSEIDWQGIVHNANYLIYFEDGRIAYLEQIGVRLDLNAVNHDFKVVVARNEVDYLAPATIGKMLLVRTRISYIRNTSFAFEGILEDAATGERLAQNVSIHVYLDPKSGSPIPIPDDFRRKVQEFEGPDVVISWPTYLA
jgi:acyl-CoA thioester hydrolase